MWQDSSTEVWCIDMMNLSTRIYAQEFSEGFIYLVSFACSHVQRKHLPRQHLEKFMMIVRSNTVEILKIVLTSFVTHLKYIDTWKVLNKI